jgi:hypothetical protein
VQQLLDQTVLSSELDKRQSPFLKPDKSLDTAALYRMIKAKGQGTDPKAVFIWKSMAPPRVKMFMWVLMQRKIQCLEVLLKKRVVDSATCEICNCHVESPEHIIHVCSIGKEVWIRLCLQSMLTTNMSEMHMVSNRSPSPIPELPTFLSLICWHIWKARNTRVFRQETVSVDQVLNDCKTVAELWQFRFHVSKRSVVPCWCNILMMARQEQS